MDEEEIAFMLPMPKPEFQAMSDAELQKAIRNRHTQKSKKVIAELGRLVDEYISNFKTYISENGTAPFLLEVKVR